VPILRHVISHLRRQDWTAVFIEMVVVVVGVFTERLRSDLREEAWGYEYEVGYFKGVLTSAKRAADALSGKIPLSYEALLVAGYRPPNIASTSAVGSPTTTLTGEIGLIRDPTLRDLAMRLLTAPMFDSIHEEGIDNPYRKAFRMAIPYEVQDALRSAYGDRLVSTGDYKAIGHSLDHPCVRRIFTRAP
jgi:hypothetical protein